MPGIPPRSVARWAPSVLVALAACGGGDGLPRESIDGTVTIDGQPLALGSITFTPVAEGGVQSGGVIADGRYTVARDQGPTPGKYRVQISSAAAEAMIADQEAQSGMPGQVSSPSPKRRDPIPPEYNRASTQEVEVKAGSRNTFDFPIASAKAKKK